MQSAVLLAERGNQMSLYDRENELGGQWRLASKMPGKQDYASFINYLRGSLDRLGVPVAMGTEVTREQVLAMKPDVVIVATGAVP